MLEERAATIAAATPSTAPPKKPECGGKFATLGQRQDGRTACSTISLVTRLVAASSSRDFCWSTWSYCASAVACRASAAGLSSSKAREWRNHWISRSLDDLLVEPLDLGALQVRRPLAQVSDVQRGERLARFWAHRILRRGEDVDHIGLRTLDDANRLADAVRGLARISDATRAARSVLFSALSWLST